MMQQSSPTKELSEDEKRKLIREIHHNKPSIGAEKIRAEIKNRGFNITQHTVKRLLDDLELQHCCDFHRNQPITATAKHIPKHARKTILKAYEQQLNELDRIIKYCTVLKEENSTLKTELKKYQPLFENQKKPEDHVTGNLRILENDLTAAIAELKESTEVKQATQTEESKANETFIKKMKEVALALGPDWDKRPVILPAGVNNNILVTGDSEIGYKSHDDNIEVECDDVVFDDNDDDN